MLVARKPRVAGLGLHVERVPRTELALWAWNAQSSGSVARSVAAVRSRARIARAALA